MHRKAVKLMLRGELNFYNACRWIFTGFSIYTKLSTETELALLFVNAGSVLRILLQITPAFYSMKHLFCFCLWLYSLLL